MTPSNSQPPTCVVGLGLRAGWQAWRDPAVTTRETPYVALPA